MMKTACEIVDILLSEGAPIQEDDNMFLSKITDANDIDFKGAENAAELIDRANVLVQWSAEFEYRSWGIRDVILHVHNLSGSVYLTGFEEVPGEEEGRDTEREINLEGWRVQTRVSPREGGDFRLYPSELELDEAHRTAVVVF